MVETELLSRFLQSGESVAIGGEIRDHIVIDRLEQQARRTTQTLLDQFFQKIDRKTAIIYPDVAIPVFLLGKLLQMTPLDKMNPLRTLQDIVSGYIEEFDLEGVKRELLAAEDPPTRTELVSSILRTIRALLESG